MRDVGQGRDTYRRRLRSPNTGGSGAGGMNSLATPRRWHGLENVKTIGRNRMKRLSALTAGLALLAGAGASCAQQLRTSTTPRSSPSSRSMLGAEAERPRRRALGAVFRRPDGRHRQVQEDGPATRSASPTPASTIPGASSAGPTCRREVDSCSPRSPSSSTSTPKAPTTSRSPTSTTCSPAATATSSSSRRTPPPR